jgi:hypothetical protein
MRGGTALVAIRHVQSNGNSQVEADRGVRGAIPAKRPAGGIEELASRSSHDGILNEVIESSALVARRVG